jgi:dGTPase
MLAPYAVRVEESRGRRHPEPPHPYRNDFQRDRDRVIHARAFRRLENKTQVFTRRHSDHFRNRLTHTIEVAQISRTIAQQLALNEDLVEALALVHDIGHPPFGHNLHALRIVEQFEDRYADFRGLNLTFEVREGIIKHSRQYGAAEYPQLAEYLLDQQPPLEAQLIDLTDEIAYNTADLDDGYEARLLPLAAVRERVPLFERFYSAAEARHPAAREKLKFNAALRQMVNYFVTDLIQTTRVRVTATDVKSLADVRRNPARLAAFSDAVDAERTAAKSFLYERLYYSDALMPEKHHAEQVVRDLFELWMAHPEALPARYQQQAEREPLPRVICDYIAGMTDNYILAQHERLCGRARGV